MKSNYEKLNTLLDEVLPSSLGNCGPSCAELLDLLRREGRRRRSRTAWVAVMALILTIVLWKHAMPTKTSLAQTPSKPAPLAIRQVNDEQLFALLEDTPAALVSLPDGTTKLLILNP
ncbi:MAG: hypothetical protein ACYC67_02295 [Prosthecobacter sp.]